jgi:hypothetical protein
MTSGDLRVTLTPATPSTAQLAAWQRLWGLLLAPDIASHTPVAEGPSEVIARASASLEGASAIATRCAQESPEVSATG